MFIRYKYNYWYIWISFTSLNWLWKISSCHFGNYMIISMRLAAARSDEFEYKRKIYDSDGWLFTNKQLSESFKSDK